VAPIQAAPLRSACRRNPFAADLTEWQLVQPYRVSTIIMFSWISPVRNAFACSGDEMATTARGTELTVADLSEMFGPMPFRRIVREPPPGTATERDVLAIHGRDKRLCELVDGILVEKPRGYEESLIAVELIRFLATFVAERKLGFVTGEGGMMKLAKGLVRIPDVAFVSKGRLPGGKPPRRPIPNLAPNLALEVLSKNNTTQEMERKLVEYFEAGVELVWFVDPRARTVEVFTAPDASTLFKTGQTVTGGKVVPGFKLKLRDLFAALDGR
jgi:Uma2 family endonuclease